MCLACRFLFSIRLSPFLGGNPARLGLLPSVFWEACGTQREELRCSQGTQGENSTEDLEFNFPPTTGFLIASPIFASL